MKRKHPGKQPAQRQQRRLTIILAGSILALGLLVYLAVNHSGTGGTAKAEARVGIGVGNRAPDFMLSTLTGQEVRLSDLRGKPVLINFWATWCPPCRGEMPDLQRVWNASQDSIYLVAVNNTSSEEPPSGVPDFIRRQGYTYPVVLDPTNAAIDLYQVDSLPTSFFLDADGIVRAVWRGQMNLTTIEANLAKARAN